jgi:hypothetical protein
MNWTFNIVDGLGFAGKVVCAMSEKGVDRSRRLLGDQSQRRF